MNEVKSVAEEHEEEIYSPFDAQFIVEAEGRVEIGNDVIVRIAGIASTEVEGVTLEHEGKFNLTDLITRKDRDPLRGLTVERIPEENAVQISATVRMEYGQDMYDAAVRFRRHIKDTIEKMTRLRVKGVDIKIVGITLPEREAAARIAQIEGGEKRPAAALPPGEDTPPAPPEKGSKTPAP